MKVTLEYGATLPSYNSYQRAHWAKQAKLKRKWQGIFEGLLLEAGVPRGRFGSCVASAELRFPVERRRDSGNFQTPIEKMLGDALQAWIPDDTHDRFRFEGVEILPKGAPLTRLTLVFSEEREAA